MVTSLQYKAYIVVLTNIPCQVLELWAVCNQFFFCRNINSHITRMFYWRGSHSYVNLREENNEFSQSDKDATLGLQLRVYLLSWSIVLDCSIIEYGALLAVCSFTTTRIEISALNY